MYFTAKSQTIASELYELNPTYSDEFNSFNSNLWRTNNWNPQTQQMGEWCQEETWFINNCVSFSSGNLKITPYIGTNVPGCGTYKSGCLTSNNEFLYGYYEASVKMPAQPYNAVSSWWNSGGCTNARPYALYNEMDIFETSNATIPHEAGAVLFGTNKDNCIGGSSYGYHYSDSRYPGYLAAKAVSDMTTSFHTFGLEWTPDIVNFYFDGALYRSITILGFNKKGDPNYDRWNIFGDYAYVKELSTPVNFYFWVKKHPTISSVYNPNGTKSLEVEYFRYYKPKPILKGAYKYNNYLTLSASTIAPNETYTWTVNSGNLTIINQGNGTANFSIPSGFSTSTIFVSATGGIPNATANATFDVINCNGNFCAMSGLGSTPVLYIANDFNVPQSGCSSTIIPNGKNVIFVSQNSVTLNPGFEVQLGATFSAF